MSKSMRRHPKNICLTGYYFRQGNQYIDTNKYNKYLICLRKEATCH
ncbi:hypothetical protein A1OE_912 [Candidatus Endolissoclinum faulkneri L2]|uniref:Uncharacterized protein n=1 Tax=Candidatus Endolissoclinum faulkneri L2 TaxID=1193729 RepID=K7ZD19_9PROT|nr:hypothetical protein A1OE_912 [Candidatus Endolissoclinum faulkneri L2]